MTSAPDAPKRTIAQRRRDLIYMDRSKTLELIESSEWGRAKMAATEHLLRPGLTRLETADWAMDQLWRKATAAASKVKMPGVVRTVQDLEVVFLPREEVAASCESFSDGSGLVSISDALTLLVWRLSIFNASWRGVGSLRSRLGRRRKVRKALANPNNIMDEPVVQAATAALRYTTQHIRVWGTTAAVGPRKERAGLRDGALAVAFIHAHEIGHFVLGHDLEAASDKSPADREFEADEFALSALLGTYGAFDRVAVGAAAIIALCALQVWESAALLRDVRAHPPILERWQVLARMLGSSSLEAEGHTFAVRVMSGVTAAPGSIPSGFWNALREDREYEIVHGLPYLKMIEGFDRTESMSNEQRDELVGTFAASSPLFVEGWRALRARGWEPAYAAWRISPSGLFDTNRPLSFLHIVNRIATAPVWEDTSDSLRRSCALLAIHARSSDLMKVS